MSKCFHLMLAAIVAFGLASCEEHGPGGRGTSKEFRDNGDPNAVAGGSVTTPDAGTPEADEPAETVAAATGVTTPTTILKGKVTFAGPKMPKKRPLSTLEADPTCNALHPGGVPVSDQFVIDETTKAMGNVIVSISQGLPENKWDIRSDEVVVDQKGCVYFPHVLAVMARQEFEIKNSDAMLHNVNIQSKKSAGVNKGMPGVGSFKHTFRKAEPEPVFVKCDVHPWMAAYVGVFDHPYFAVTKADGTWEFPLKVQPGTYIVQAWHERLGTVTQKVEVTAEQESVEVPAFEIGG